jgi:hypothetical protein
MAARIEALYHFLCMGVAPACVSDVRLFFNVSADFQRSDPLSKGSYKVPVKKTDKPRKREVRVCIVCNRTDRWTVIGLPQLYTRFELNWFVLFKTALCPET